MPLHPLPRDDRNRVRRVHLYRQPVRRHGREAVGPARPAAGDRGAAGGDEPLSILVHKTANPVLRSHLFQRLKQQERANASMIRQLNTMARDMTDDSRFLAFSELITSPAYAATALHLMATTSKSHQVTNDWLLTHLADKQIGGDAAVALSRRLTPSLTNQLAEYLNSDDKVLARRAELALSLAEDNQARAIIRQLRIQQSVSDNSETDL